MTMDPSTLNLVMAGAIVVITGGVYMLQRHSDARQRADDLAEGKTEDATERGAQASTRLVSSNKPRKPKIPGNKQK